MKNVRRICNLWTDVLVVIEPRAYTPKASACVVWKLRGNVAEWPRHGQIIDIGVLYYDQLVPL